MNKTVINIAGALVALGGLFFLSFLAGVGYILPLLLFTLFIYSRYSPRCCYDYFILGLLLTIIVFTARTIVFYPGHPSLYLIPVAAVSMLCTILFNDITLTLVLSLAASLSAGIIAGGDIYLSCILFVGGLFSGFLVLGLRRRSQIMKAGIAAGIIQTMGVVLLNTHHLDNILPQIIPNLVNGLFSGIFVAGALPIFEYLSGTATNITLLELSDSNHPLLKKMVLEAPGTYHHSLIVGNLSETAAEAIGANSLLARIGAYYHDIGKTAKAEYFIENQQVSEGGGWAHDQLKPSMSKMVIINHVKEGIELGRRYKLNDSIIDFIAQHHGTSLVFYFYCRALENEDEDEQVEEEGFRYSGPKPQSKETAIVLLADSVEGAVRALKDRTPKKISEMVRKVINNKFIDGQLDECELTLSDLNKIAGVFSRILSAVYHARIDYPAERPDDKNSNSSRAQEADRDR
ncbi:MAG: HD family phosphohydrolase [Candidatus Omnitrophota bacterium]